MTEYSPVLTDDGSLTLLHPDLAECFHSKGGARLEAHSLYVEASGVRSRLAHPGQVRILDVGLGLGYNAMATLQAFHDAVQISALDQASVQNVTVDLVSLECSGELIQQLRTGTGLWQHGWSETWLGWCHGLQELERVSEVYCQPSSGDDGAVLFAALVPAPGCKINWYVVQGDALKVAPNLRPGFHYIWQDPFSPKSNPVLWTEAWFRTLFQLTEEGCTLMTYSVAGAVRRALEAAGWSAQKIPGQGSKRQWLRAEAHKGR